jgi:hypothetical protein
VLIKRQRGEFLLTDVEGQTRTAHERLVPVSVCKRGHWSTCGEK